MSTIEDRIILKSFFAHLSERWSNENSLSDITWAVAKADPTFMKTFMDAFGFDFTMEKPWEMYREISENDRRPDFRIEQGDNLFIIENKIYDRNNHFSEYADQFETAKRGFIANYRVEQKVVQKYGFVCITWEDFIGMLSKEIQEIDPEIINERILMRQAYIEYVREVCTIVDIKKIKLDNIVSLYHFNNLLKRVIQSPIENYECWLYNRGTPYDDSSSGRYLGLRRKGSKVEVYPWFGIWYEEKTPSILLCFGKEWSRYFYNRYDVKQSKGIYFDKAYNDEYNSNAITFELNVKNMQEFMKGSVKKQEEILHNFFKEVVGEVGKVL